MTPYLAILLMWLLPGLVRDSQIVDVSRDERRFNNSPQLIRAETGTHCIDNVEVMSHIPPGRYHQLRDLTGGGPLQQNLQRFLLRGNNAQAGDQTDGEQSPAFKLFHMASS